MVQDQPWSRSRSRTRSRTSIFDDEDRARALTRVLQQTAEGLGGSDPAGVEAEPQRSAEVPERLIRSTQSHESKEELVVAALLGGGGCDHMTAEC